VIALKQVLVATDFGEASDVALRYGSELARQFGAHLHVVHVIEDYITRANSLPGVPESYIDWGRWQTEAIAAAERNLKVLVADDDRVSGKPTVAAIVSRSIPRTLIEYARQHQVDLIVTGTHGRGVVGHLVMGSVAERLVRYAPCPVLTVRHPEREFVMPDALQIMQAGG
jgi:universal stress protein A